MFTAQQLQSERIEKWLSKIYWADININSALVRKQSIISPLSLEVLVLGRNERPLFCEIMPKFNDKTCIRGATIGESFGPSWATMWFKVKFSIPESTPDLFLRWDSSSEAMVYSESGKALQAFNGSDGADRREYYALDQSTFSNSDVVTFYIEMACNGMFGNGDGGMIRPPNENRTFALRKCDIVQLQPGSHRLYWNMKVIYDVSKLLPSSSPIVAKAATLGNTVIDRVDLTDQQSINYWAQRTDEFFEGNNPGFTMSPMKADAVMHDVFAVGHCHIDTAWLWTYAETRRKIARSWATQLSLMERYPHWKFVASQAIQWEWLREDYPELSARVVEAVKSNRFIPIGCSYVEFDANVPSGESMVRQFLYGFDAFEREIGVKPRVFWLPDTFGYSGQLPQIMAGFDIPYFLSQKLSWNLMNKFPHSTFYWEGIDGSRVIAHFPPADTYNSSAGVQDVLKSCDNHQSKGCSNRSLLLFGHGDGGGGPEISHLEQLSRVQHLPALPKVHIESSPETFFEMIETQDFGFDVSSLSWINSMQGSRKARDMSDRVGQELKRVRSRVPRFVGELYLELHQGTLTSQATTKRLNRSCEQVLKALEYLLVVFASLKPNSTEIETFKSQIKKCWKDTLLNQFHDVIPGSSIGDVYIDANRMLLQVISDCDRLCQELLSLISGNHKDLSMSSHIYVNALDHTRNVSLNEKSEKLTMGALEIVGVVSSNSNVADNDVALEQYPKVTRNEDQSISIENSSVIVVINASGSISSVLDKRVTPHRQVVSDHECANRLMLYDDVPFYWDAWDVFPYHVNTGHPLNCTDPSRPHSTIVDIEIVDYVQPPPSVGQGFEFASERRSGVCVTMTQFGSRESVVKQIISLGKDSPTIYFDSEVDWHESHKLLKVEFPLAIRSRFASYEIQFGIMERSTHENTPQEAAMFEVCGHRFADLSEPGYGAALMNDCKYGYSCRENTLSLTLLRSPKAPDANCDMGLHRFRYALYLHTSDSLTESNVVAAAQEFNMPLVKHDVSTCTTNALSLVGRVEGLFQWKSQTSVILEAIKLSERDSKEVVIRVYESCGGRGRAKMHSTWRDIASVRRLNLNEEPLINEVQRFEVDCKMNGFEFDYLPFEVLTFGITLH